MKNVGIKRREWSKFDIKLLLEYSRKGLSNEEIARKLKRTKYSIQWKLYKNLKIRKNDLRLPKFKVDTLNKLYYENGLTLKEIAKRFNCSESYVFNQMKKLKIPRDRRRCGRKPLAIPNKNYKKLTPDKAYILGVLCGDGMLYKFLASYKNYKFFNYYLGLRVVDKEFAKEFVNKIKNVYSVNATVSKIPAGIRKTPVGYLKCKQQVLVSLRRKKIYEDLARYGKFTTYSWRVPQEIKNGSRLIISSFLRGFFDSEGSVDISNGAVEACSFNKEGLKDISFLLGKFGIFTKVKRAKKDRNLFRIRFGFSGYLKVFRDNINFTIKRKKEALDRIIKNKRKYKYCPEDYWKVLRLRIKGYTSNEISSMTRIPRSTVKSWFRRPAYIALQAMRLNKKPDDWYLLAEHFPFLKKCF
ncbi:MAG: LAGLIDADG family homing endonuclease [Candidatus Aenigmatarchaeota archaeon]